MREAFDSEILHDLFDLLFEVHHFRLEFRSLFYAVIVWNGRDTSFVS